MYAIGKTEKYGIMRCLITGINGFIGGYLSEFLKENGHEIIGIQHSKITEMKQTAEIHACDVTHETELKQTLQDSSPVMIFHLAGQSLPSVSWQDPERTLQVNLIGTLNLLNCVKTLGLAARIVLFGSSSEYAPSRKPISESFPLKPSSPYALSKIGSSLLGGLYHEAYGIDVVTVRPFFVIGPRKTGDVCSSFARGIVQIERGAVKALNVGNLSAVRDFLDVSDAVRAIWLVSDKAKAGEVFNISSGKGTPVLRVLEVLKSKARTAIPIEESLLKSRPLDTAVAIGDNQKLRSLGWNPKIGLSESLSRVLEYWRNVA